MKIFFNKDNFKLWALFVVSLIIALVVYKDLPEQIPVHWGIKGEVDGWGSRLFIFLGPAATLLMIVFAEIRRIDPHKQNYEKFRKPYYTVYFVVSLIFLLIELVTIAYVKGIIIDLSVVLSVAIGILFIIMGNVMPKFKHNYFAGIRTSWTLANEDVWYETHRFGGRVWFICGILMVVCAFLPTIWKVISVLGGAIGGAIASTVYSFICYRRIEKEKKENEKI